MVLARGKKKSEQDQACYFLAIKIWSNLVLVIEAYSDEVRRRQGKNQLVLYDEFLSHLLF